jgi:hypothetical protein
MSDRRSRIVMSPEPLQYDRPTSSEHPPGSGGTVAVVSCLTFHEIGDVERKADGLVEALRVMRPGGRYVFLDLFGDPAFYPSVEDVREAIGRAGASIVEFGSLAGALPLPFPLRHPKVLGHAMLIVGSKPPAATS